MRVLVFQLPKPFNIFSAIHELADSSSEVVQILALVTFVPDTLTSAIQPDWYSPNRRITICPITYPGDDKLYLARLAHVTSEKEFVDSRTVYFNPARSEVIIGFPEGTCVGGLPLVPQSGLTYFWSVSAEECVSYENDIKNHVLLRLLVVMDYPKRYDGKIKALVHDELADCQDNKLFLWSLGIYADNIELYFVGEKRE